MLADSNCINGYFSIFLCVKWNVIQIFMKATYFYRENATTLVQIFLGISHLPVSQ